MVRLRLRHRCPSRHQPRRRPSAPLWVAMVLACSGCLGSSPSPRALPAIDLPDLRIPSVRHTNVDYLGRPLVINVFASTCVPCKKELPMMTRVAAQEPGVAFLGIDQLEFRPAALAFVTGLGVDFPVALDESGDLAVSLQLAGLPTTIFVDPDGRETARVTGPITENSLRQHIHALLR